MKNYLSFGGGVNSVALYLYLLDQKIEFEAVFVDHGTDWPETYEYVEMFKKKYPLTVLKPDVGGISVLYDYSMHYRLAPSIRVRWCTQKFKTDAIYKYIEAPCFMMLGIDAGEAKRAKLSVNKGAENRFPLIEADIDRNGCKKIIKDHGLPIPIRSGCYICPFQRATQWKELRMKHPKLFCQAKTLEDAQMARSKEKGKKPFTISPRGVRLESIVDENQRQIFKQDEYPPCECGL